ncbi:uncharacterized protein HMPREF1541_01636 [Cyphellophora europaea CBS 101466]|uniref:Phytocyanin domain-containing protein n=1 Tax=Cyphellophora europaea (strain CBS 101466) TaxID=1220924 RepID=W2S1M4_CYPE1|nr:uncharacterized protein HMPREF1541_01636 [Cyphellophora europaea CBS 101466]ETN42480.1 hypothetical protein HMPREF1541_01636 [Cyphellophora europaea CBS 101466]
MLYTLPISLLLFFTHTALSAIHTVQAGPSFTDLKFTPNTLTNVAAGDVIAVKFGAGHNIAQSTFSEPCVPISGDGGGVYSGPSPKDGQTFSFRVNSTDSAFFYCAIPGHCEAGMALAVNPSGSDTLDAYTSAASKATGSAPSGNGPIGGTFGALSESSSSSSASGSGPTSSSSPSSASTSASASASGSPSPSANGSSIAASMQISLVFIVGIVAGTAAFAL